MTQENRHKYNLKSKRASRVIPAALRESTNLPALMVQAQEGDKSQMEDEAARAED